MIFSNPQEIMHHLQPGFKVYVANLSFNTDWRVLKDHMKACGFVNRADIFEDDKGRSRGNGYV